MTLKFRLTLGTVEFRALFVVNAVSQGFGEFLRGADPFPSTPPPDLWPFSFAPFHVWYLCILFGELLGNSAHSGCFSRGRGTKSACVRFVYDDRRRRAVTVFWNRSMHATLIQRRVMHEQRKCARYSRRNRWGQYVTRAEWKFLGGAVFKSDATKLSIRRRWQQLPKMNADGSDIFLTAEIKCSDWTLERDGFYWDFYRDIFGKVCSYWTWGLCGVKYYIKVVYGDINQYWSIHLQFKCRRENILK